MAQHAALGRQVLLGARREVAVSRQVEKLLCAKGFAPPHGSPRREIRDGRGETERVVWRSEPRQVPKPADERLRVAHPNTDVDMSRKALTRYPRTGWR
jgi:hypothetical protein